MPIPILAFSHIRLTVTDIERSRAFYESVLGLPVAIETPPGADAATRVKFAFLFGGVLYRLGDGSMLGLRPVGSETFNEDRVGLDHVSLAVGSRSDLDDAVEVFDAKGVAHGDVKDIGEGWILEFRDPDNVALELTAPKA